MDREALCAFNEARLDMQFELFAPVLPDGTPKFPATYDDTKGHVYPGLRACHSAVRNRKDLRDGGFEMSHDFIARLRRSEVFFTPCEEALFSIRGRTYIISEVVDNELSGEWKFGLRSAV